MAEKWTLYQQVNLNREGGNVLPHSFLTPILGGGQRLTSTLRPLHLLKTPGTHLIGGWVGPRAGLDFLEKRKSLPLRGFEPRIVEPVA